MATKRKEAPAAAKPRAVKKPAPKKPAAKKVAAPKKTAKKEAAPEAPLCKPDDAGIDWDRIRADYEIGAKALKVIAQEHGINWQKITTRATRDGWPKRAEVRTERRPRTGGALPVDAEALAGRLIKLIAREIADVEAQRKVTRDEALGERQARRLASLVRSADKLHEIEQAARQAKKNDPESDRERQIAEEDRVYAELQSRFARYFAFVDQKRLRPDASEAGDMDTQ
ncbi:MAG: hypothetical protein Q7V31_06315 [Parvibaculum sp.]|uniref:hypothetical protein n=1 Tax=Parvibaculum sp. TaxID=2024848 RepID=UPI0027156773|nr:hypothetical protein [Parvibaculum sp.]MDO8838526.1 hypothetical protein [Parvibaculum sp.]